jgi:DNA-binding HxlR family transcriptional regulator
VADERVEGQDTRSLEAALDRVGDRWSLLVVQALLEGSRRWSDLADEVAGIAPNVLADRLRRLEREGVVASEPYSRRPLRRAYALTAEGRELAGPLRLLADWGARGGGGVEAPRHRTCGTPMDARWFCPTCEALAEEPHDPTDAPDVVVV